MPLKYLKYKIADFLVGLAGLMTKNKEKKQLTQENVQKELKEFIESNGFTDADFASEKFRSDFVQYLTDKNYDCEGAGVVEYIANSGKRGPVGVKKLPRNIQKISEDLNNYINGLEIFSRTLNMAPGLVCYTIEKIAPNNKKPYVTYRPTPRVITQIHENGVNGGTIFLTCLHKFVKSVDFNGEKTGKVVSEDEALYTLLTKEHALYVCRILNAQSRIFYIQQIKKQQRTK